MELGSFFLVLALALLVGLFVSRPFFDRQLEPRHASVDKGAQQQEQQRSVLLARRDRLLAALAELDFDHTLGKIPEEDYPQQRARMLQSGAEVLRDLDALEKSMNGQRSFPNDNGPANEAGPAEAGSPEDELENMLAAHRRARAENAAGFCPKCGMPVQKSDKFCSRCGAAV